MKSKGMVVKIKDNKCIVLMKNGTYRKVSLAGRQNLRIGSEIEVSPVNWLGYFKPAVLVASMLLMVLGLSLFQGVMTPEAFAYVSLDINPSVEFKIDGDFKVLQVIPVNSDAEKLLTGMNLEGQNLYSVINLVLDRSEQEGYLKPGQKNYIISTYTPISDTPGQPEAFAESMSAKIENKNIDIDIIVLSADRSLRTEAKNKGLSTGKLIVYKNVYDSGAKVDFKEIKDSSVTNLVNSYKVKLLPNEKKLVVKSINIPPRNTKKALEADEVRKQFEERINGKKTWKNKPGQEDKKQEDKNFSNRERQQPIESDKDKENPRKSSTGREEKGLNDSEKSERNESPREHTGDREDDRENDREEKGR